MEAIKFGGDFKGATAHVAGDGDGAHRAYIHAEELGHEGCLVRN